LRKLARRTAAVIVVSAALVPVAATAASADPIDTVNNAYCNAQEKAGFLNVQDCRYLIR
jgi:hypothetical protein